jgi:hypothetical protein
VRRLGTDKQRGTGTLEKPVEEIASGHRLTGEFLNHYSRAVPSLEALA